MTIVRDKKTSKNVYSLKRALKLLLLNRVTNKVAVSHIVIRTLSTNKPIEDESFSGIL